ncbi:MAG TPA: GNAT family N-acetyltransferase [Acetobacteraceae bacterium]|jgi:ribosomal protein S18 acetylase RimI-like enzyme|nr:GNAT family N-acetyltransferase [Acetobacteraceae bacterium]
MSPPNYRIRRLDGMDAHILRPVRLAALRLHPEAYGTAYEEEVQAPIDDLARRLLLPPATMFGGFVGHSLVGITGLVQEMRTKTRHKATVFSVYVDAAYRSGGLGGALVEAAITHARAAGVRMLHLTVTVGNDAARRLYERQGFRSIAIEPRALLVNGMFYDNEHMIADLDQPQPPMSLQGA